MATVRNGKTTGRLYTEDQTVEQPATEPQPQRGNKQGFDAGSIYRYWSAAYRGFAPHGIRLPSPQRGVEVQFDDNPETFEEATDEQEEPAKHLDIKPYTITDFKSYTANVGTTPVMVTALNDRRVKILLYNAGPGTVWIAHNENVVNQGFPLLTTTQPLELITTREIWAVQQTGQVSLAQLSMINQYEKEVGI